MFAGGDQTTMIRESQTYYCGGAFRPSWDPVAQGQADPQVAACNTQVENEMTPIYAQLTSATQITNFERYVQVWWIQPYFACFIGSGMSASGANAQTGPAATQCMAEYAGGRREIEIGDLKFKVFGASDPNVESFLEWAVKMTKAGIPFDITVLLEDYVPVPEAVLNAIHEFTGNDPFLNEEMIRLYQEAMRQRSTADRNNADIQNKIVMSIIDQMRPVKEAMEAEAFKMNLVKTYVDYVSEPADGQFVVNMRQIPEDLATKLAASTSFDVNNLESMREVRRLFVLAENIVKKDAQVQTHLGTLTTQEARDAYLNPIRTQLVDKLVIAARAKIRNMAAGDIAAELAKYDVEVDMTVTDNGAVVSIDDLRLVERAELYLPPADLIFRTGAANNPMRMAALIRLWAQVIEFAPNARTPGELQNGLVENLVPQLAPITDEQMRTTIVTAVDEPAMTVTLNQLPTALLDPVADIAGSIAGLDDERNRIFSEFATMWNNAHPNEPLNENALAMALRAMLRPILLAGNLFQLDDIHPASISANESGGYDISIDIREGSGGDGVVYRTSLFTVGGEMQLQVGAGTPGIGGWVDVAPEFTFNFSKWKLMIGVEGLGAVSNDVLTRTDEESLHYSEGASNFLRLYKIFAKAAIDLGQEAHPGVEGEDNDTINISAGLISNRFPSTSMAFDPDFNYIFGLSPVPSSVGLGGRVDVSFDFVGEDGPDATAGHTEGTAGVIAMQNAKINIWTSESVPAYQENGSSIAGYLAFKILASHAGNVHVGGDLAYYYGMGGAQSLLNADISLDAQPLDWLKLAAGFRYSREWNPSQPEEMQQWSIAAGAFFPFTVAGDIGITPYGIFTYTDKSGDVTWGGECTDGGVTTLGGIPAGGDIGGSCSNTFGVGYSGYALDLGVNVEFGKHFVLRPAGWIANGEGLQGGATLLFGYKF